MASEAAVQAVPRAHGIRDDDIRFTGTDPQIAGPINAPLATCRDSMSCAALPILDTNTEGCKRPIRIVRRLARW
jgi:N-methylhydantoinase B/oxoprolinase/acetone carboxylase alpha subunit